MDFVAILQKELEELRTECAELRTENAHLKRLLGIDQKCTNAFAPKTNTHSQPPGTTKHESYINACADANDFQKKISTPQSKSLSVSIISSFSTKEKVALFRSLFRGRDDVYPIRWESTKGTSGYSPSCKHEWNRAYCDKPKIKCGQCKNRKFLPVTDEVIYKHLAGNHTIGVYPLLEDDTCWFIAADFDKEEWLENAAAFLETCQEFNIPAAVERSRSGNGGHVWIFFAENISAALARKLGFILLAKTLERRHQVGLRSYDRFFPTQDSLPNNGFGNLIALPLQKKPREKGNSVFLNSAFQIFQDQWAYLSNIQRMTLAEVESIVEKSIRNGDFMGIRSSRLSEDAEEDPWTLPPSGKKEEKLIYGPLPKKVHLVRANMLYVKKEGLPPALANKLMRIAAFKNPEFYKMQAMRLSTYGKSPVVSCAEDYPKYIGLPRGCLGNVKQLMDELNIQLDMEDKRYRGKPIKVSFSGKLRKIQREAVKDVRKHDIGILSAATAFGKTVVAAKLIAVRKRNVLILVHRRLLMDQWQEKLSVFLSIPKEEIGLIGGGKRNPTHKIDIGILQSLNRDQVVDDIVAEYGHVIVDECHRLAPFSFELIMKQVKARYILGLTATPIRKDGHHPIVIMQCGPIRHRFQAKAAALIRPFDHHVFPCFTTTRIPGNNEQLKIQDIYKLQVTDEERNEQIVADIVKVVREGRSPLLLTERTGHLSVLAELLEGKIKNVVILKGGMGKKKRQEIYSQIESIGAGEERVLLATGKYVGEGFDDARLDTLFLVMPISWKGTLQQYAGRLHRDYDGKKEVRIYDYVDHEIPMLMRMYKKRLQGYKSIGYSIMEEDSIRR